MLGRGLYDTDYVAVAKVKKRDGNGAKCHEDEI
jgi:hypothetical protein